jgi:hypothetical protein
MQAAPPVAPERFLSGATEMLSAQEPVGATASTRLTAPCTAARKRGADLADRIWAKKQEGVDWSEWRRQNPVGKRRVRNYAFHNKAWTVDPAASGGAVDASLPAFDPATAFHSSFKSHDDGDKAYKGGFVKFDKVRDGAAQS